MGQVSVTIDGKSYRMACEDGQETHLEGLAALLDERIGRMRQAFGEIGDMRLTIMGAITLADEITELRRKVAAYDAEHAQRAETEAAAAAEAEARDGEMAVVLGTLAQRVDRLRRRLDGEE
jgi:cell division protein ZapA